jgi:hypothetical protein
MVLIVKLRLIAILNALKVPSVVKLLLQYYQAELLMISLMLKTLRLILITLKKEKFASKMEAKWITMLDWLAHSAQMTGTLP